MVINLASNEYFKALKPGLEAKVITPGFKESEWLHANGYFQYADDDDPGGGSTITIDAAGRENTESMQLWIDGSPVKTSAA